MDSIRHMNQAMAYIETHLTEEIDYGEAAKIALCSEYHLKRMFTFLAGISLTEYVRRRRLSLAATELKHSNLRILDIAVKYGYQSADAFSRAFQNQHGILPSEAKADSARLVAYPKMTFQMSIQGGKEMNYRIIEKEEFYIVGLQKRVPIVFNGVNPEIAKMTQSLTPELIMTLKSMSDQQPKGIISASANFSEGRMAETGELDHYIGVATSKSFAPSNALEPTNLLELSNLLKPTNPESSITTSVDENPIIKVLEVSKGTWAVFESRGPFPETLQNTWARIYSEWFPGSGYEAVEGPELVWHESPDTSLPEYFSEIWIPVKLKK